MNIKNLDRPDWFVLIEQWVARGMGQTGITLAFLSGALAFKRGATSSSEAELRKVLADLIETPVDGYV
ncbi:MAG: hypothetical protein ABIO49_04225, partial [Dokdonella sp.]